MTLEEMRKALAECEGMIEAFGAETAGAALTCDVYADILRDAVAFREMMTERKAEELEDGKYYITRSKHRRPDGTPFNWFVGIKFDERVIMALCISAYYVGECEKFYGPIPMPEVTQ